MKKHNDISKLVYFVTNRFVLFLVFLTLFFVSFYLYSGSFFPSADTKDLWFYSGLFMVLFSILFIEPYYTSPKNVITNVIPLLLVFLSIKPSFTNLTFWWAALVVIIMLLLASIVSLVLEDRNKSPDNALNKFSEFLTRAVVVFGRGKVLYSVVFVYFLFTYYTVQDSYTLILFLFWFLILIIDPKYVHNEFFAQGIKNKGDQIGEIFGVQSKKVFLAKLFEDRVSIKKFDIVKFRYSMQDGEALVISGIVFDTYLLNQEKWAKILQLKEPEKEDQKLDKNIVYKLSNSKRAKTLSKEMRVNDFVGIVIDGSNIGKIRFEYSKKKDDLQEGDLLELHIGEKRLFYQVVNGTTEKEKLEARNETGFIDGEAIQLGEWNNQSYCFQKFGWVPSINTPIFTASVSDIEIKDQIYPDYNLGIIPGTTLPSVLNLDDAISHHMALLGITGSGKSFLAREIIKEIKTDTKVICVDFNKEFVTTLDPAPANIIDDKNAEAISEKIDWINNELEKFGNQQDKAQIAIRQKEIKDLIKGEIVKFLDDTQSSIKVFELPDVSNTTGILDYTKYFFRVLFEIAKERQNSGNAVKICVVLEEAHTVIPEWNFSGSNDKTSQALVNSIGQITLQGRKYGIGFLVIAQRTANVSKTVLTQCNTVICFQAFDETSFTFLENYVGKDMVQALPILKKHHAVVAGKGVKSNMPMIVDLHRE